MRSVLRCAFQAFRSPRQRVATKQLLFGTRSAAKTATTTSKNLITTFCTPKLQHIARFSPIQRRFYSSETKPASEHLLKAAWEEVNKNPEKAIALFNQLLESAGTQTPFLYGKANALSNLGRFDEALELLDQLSAINPDEPVSGLKGAIHLKMENFELAVEHFEDANKRFPNELSILKPLAEAYIRAGRPFDALETLQQADEISPNDWDVINNLGICFRSLGPMYVTHALTLAQRAVELHPDAAHFWHNLAEIYMSIGEFDKSEECFDKMQMNDPNLALGSFNHAKLMLQMNKLDEAEKLLFKVVSLQIDDNSSFKPIDGDNLAFKANLTLFNLYIAQKRYGDAKALAEKLSKSEPFRTYGWYHLGWFTMTTNIDEAITYFEHALNIDSEDQYALDGLASCYFIKGQYDKAEEYFKRTSRFASAFASSRMYEQANAVIEFLLKKFPERASEIYNAQMGLNAFKKDYVAEFESLKKLLEASSDPIDRADLLLLNNDFEGALKVLDQLLDVDPNRLDAIIAKAIVLVENGHVKEALGWLNARRPENYDTGFAEVMTTTLSRDDDSLDKAEIFGQQFLSLFASQMAMSEVHRRRGNYEQALKSWRTSQKINQSSPDYIFPTSFPYRYLAHQQLGKILESMGDVEGAMKEYNIVLSINPLELFSKQRLEVLKSK